ncbi:MAG: helix-turn-helix transcriptional regulator [Lautropia sp.]
MLIRLMTTADLAHCLARWPLPDLPPAVAKSTLERAFRQQRVRGAVIQDPATLRVLGFGMSGFVRGANVLGLATSGMPMVASHVIREIRSEPVYLDEAEMTRAQRCDDLHLCVIAYRQQTYDPRDPIALELMHAGHSAFRLMHEGFVLQGVWQEGLPSDHEWMNAGGLLVKHRTAGSDAQPRWLYGALREDVATSWPSHTLGYVLRRSTRRLGLSAAQCRVAELALWNLDDEHVARRLSISPATVRRHWRGIFERLDTSEVLKDDATETGDRAASTRATSTRRGPERRGRILNYLRTHLHEIRPA